MITFACCLIALIVGYFVYGSFIERIIGIDPSRKTPAYTQQDGVDYIPLPTWKVFMIQFLNIAGLGPIFGAIMGAKFGTASFLWIVLGSIFAGATHDFMAGMLSLRNKGESLPEMIGRYLGNNFKQFMRGFTVLLMILVGAVFVAGPAGLLAKLTPDYLDATFWIIVVFIYYVLATLLPVDKIIGKVYPLFAVALLFMAVGILVMLFIHHPSLPELTDGLHNTDPKGLPIFPIMFVSIACGAISGFHATQSPLMARCLTNEKHAKPVFYGAMITEGIVALIWAAAATYFYQNNGMSENNAAVIVDSITKEWLGAVGGVLAILGVIAAPITSGDTAFRSARLIVADFLHLEQKNVVKRLVICIPLFLIAIGLLLYSQKDKDGFDMIWRYFAWCNQTLAVFTLWALTVYLVKSKKLYWVTLIPALFMTAVCSTYIFVAPEGLGMATGISQMLGGVITLVVAIFFFVWKYRNK
ncbi:carbon starvation protein A [Parabacteroides bouchesdurhonensis]|uniref:carbon starvation CstA family protein n=1 Tax=Parabacteroides bouchesdurhonensis TaxID=1936995 RepID=UPI000C84962A|nr:carbon starvation protein A [Parabacteroides bouchesdurhonensis]